jgi:hypothetical protein
MDLEQEKGEALPNLFGGLQLLTFLILIVVCAKLNCWIENRRDRVREQHERITQNKM